jgi:hypothetical protein
MKPKVRIMVLSGAVAIAAAWVSAEASSGRELLFSAPIQKLDRGTETVTVLGQSFHAQTAQLNIGEIVKVYGILEKSGSVSDAVVEGTNTFGANGDSVFLKGVVTNSDPALGRIEIDGLTVDYTSQLGNSQFVAPATGDVIAVSGLQPTNQGLLVASATGDAAYAVQTGGTGGFASVRSSQLIGAGSNAAQLVGAGSNAAQLVGAGGNAAQLVGAGGNAAQLVGAGGNAAQLVGAGGRGSAQLVGAGGRGAAQLVGAGGGK